MGHLFALIAIIALASSASCPGPPCAAVGTADAGAPLLMPAEGAWELTLDQPELSGPCQGIDTRALVETRLRGELGVTPDELIHLDVSGVHLEGTVWVDHLYAEGWSDTGFMQTLPDQGDGLRLPLGVTLDATISDPRHFDGELLLVMETDRGRCEANAWFSAVLLDGTEGEPDLCDQPVPADPEAPVRYPDESYDYYCE
ncbi:MAG: hypothetical protein GXP62_12035 [Oligoflexia bacterium]|nr:hypothetical protein [Oligoflexia bacterium]